METSPPGGFSGDVPVSPQPPINASHAWHKISDGRYRRDVWVRIADDIRVPNHYHALLALAGETPTTSTQIEKDLPRTGASFAKHGFTLKQGEHTWHTMRNILTAYAAHDPETGYVQSMNFLCAFLLLAGLSEEDAFWVLVALVTKVVPGYFSEGMAATKLDQRLFLSLVHKNLPPVGLQFETIAPDCIVPAIISGQWLLTLFVNVLPVSVTMLLWDLIFQSQSRTPLFAMSLALLERAEQEILTCDEMGNCVELLQGLGESTFFGASEDSFGSRASHELPPCTEYDASEVSGTGNSADSIMRRVESYLANELIVSKFGKEVSRELGRRGADSDRFLPASVASTAPAITEIDELIEGLASDLSEVISVENLALADKKTEAEEETRTETEATRRRKDAKDLRRKNRKEQKDKTRSENAGAVSDDESNASSSDDSGDWEFTPGPKNIGMEWAEGLLAAGSSASMKTFAKTHGEKADQYAERLVVRRLVDDARRVFGETNFLPNASDDSDDERSQITVSNAFAKVVTASVTVDTQIDALPAHSFAFKTAAKNVALRPVTLFAEAARALRDRKNQFELDNDVLQEMAVVTQDTAARVTEGDDDAGLSWRPGSGIRDLGMENGGLDWTQWTDSVFEHVVRRADDVLLNVLDAAALLQDLAHEIGFDGHGVAAHKKGNDGDSNASRVSKTALTAREIDHAIAGHGKYLAEALRSLQCTVSAVAELASVDIPRLKLNQQELVTDLHGEALRSGTAIEKWSVAAETRRVRKTQSAVDAMKIALDAASKAFEADTPIAAAAAVAPSTPVPGEKIKALEMAYDCLPIEVFLQKQEVEEPDDPSSLSAKFLLEDSQLDSALVSLAAASRTLTRRKNAVARERAAAETVRGHATRVGAGANKRVGRVNRISDSILGVLKTRSDDGLIKKCHLAGTSIERLGEASRLFFLEQIKELRVWLQDALVTTAMKYVVVVDAAAQRLDDVLDRTCLKIAERAAYEKTQNGKATSGSLLGSFLEEAADLIAPKDSRLGASSGTRSGASGVHGSPITASVAYHGSPTSLAKGADSAGHHGSPTPATAATDSSSRGSSHGIASGSSVPVTPGTGDTSSDSSGIEKQSVESDADETEGLRKSASHNPIRDRSKQAFSQMAGNLNDRVSKLSDVFQGTQIGGWTKRFSSGKAAGGVNGANVSLGATSETFDAKSDSAKSASSANSPSITEKRQPKEKSESRALLTARDDLKRLEHRRNALVEKKKWLRELLVSDE